MKYTPEYHSLDVPLTLTRRGFLKDVRNTAVKVGAAATLASSAEYFSFRFTDYHYKVAEAQALPEGEVKERTLKFIEEAKNHFSVEDFGYRTSDAFFTQKDGWRIAFQGALLQDAGDGIVPWNSLNEIPIELDPELELQYQIPQRRAYTADTGNINIDFQNRAQVFELSSRILAKAQEIRQKYEIGVPTAPQKSYGGVFSVGRFERIALQDWGDRIERILAGDVVKNVGRTVLAPDGRIITLPGEKMIPDEALIDSEPVDIWKPLSPLERFLSTTTRVDHMEYRDQDKVYTVDSVVTPDALFKVTVPDELKPAVGEKVIKEGKHNGLSSVTIVIARNKKELPEGIQMLPAGTSLPDGKVKWYVEEGYIRVGNQGFIFCIPDDDLMSDPYLLDGRLVKEEILGFPLNDMEERRFGGVHWFLADYFSRFIKVGGIDIKRPNVLSYDREYIYFSGVVRPFKISRR